MEFLKARLKEASTWRGIILLLTVCGVKLSPDQAAAIITLGLAIVGAVGVFAPDKKEAVPSHSDGSGAPPVPDKIEPTTTLDTANEISVTQVH